MFSIEESKGHMGKLIHTDGVSTGIIVIDKGYYSVYVYKDGTGKHDQIHLSTDKNDLVDAKTCIMQKLYG